MAGGPLAEAVGTFQEALLAGCRRPWGPGLTTLAALWNLTDVVRSSWHAIALEHSLAFTGAGRVASGVLDPVRVLDSCAGDPGLLPPAVKAMEALDRAGWEFSDVVLASLEVPAAVAAGPRVAAALAQGADLRSMWTGDEDLLAALRAGDPTEALLEALAAGATEEDVAGNVAYVAALRVARDPAALGGFLWANALHQGLRRVEILGAAPDALLEGVLQAARLGGPVEPLAVPDDPRDLRELALRDPAEAAAVTAGFLLGGGSPDALMERLVELLLQERLGPEAVQCLDAAVQQYRFRRNTPEGVHLLVAAARFLASRRERWLA